MVGRLQQFFGVLFRFFKASDGTKRHQQQTAFSSQPWKKEMPWWFTVTEAALLKSTSSTSPAKRNRRAYHRRFCFVVYVSNVVHSLTCTFRHCRYQLTYTALFDALVGSFTRTSIIRMVEQQCILQNLQVFSTSIFRQRLGPLGHSYVTIPPPSCSTIRTYISKNNEDDVTVDPSTMTTQTIFSVSTLFPRHHTVMPCNGELWWLMITRDSIEGAHSHRRRTHIDKSSTIGWDDGQSRSKHSSLLLQWGSRWDFLWRHRQIHRNHRRLGVISWSKRQLFHPYHYGFRTKPPMLPKVSPSL